MVEEIGSAIQPMRRQWRKLKIAIPIASSLKPRRYFSSPSDAMARSSPNTITPSFIPSPVRYRPQGDLEDNHQSELHR